MRAARSVAGLLMITLAYGCASKAPVASSDTDAPATLDTDLSADTDAVPDTDVPSSDTFTACGRTLRVGDPPRPYGFTFPDLPTGPGRVGASHAAGHVSVDSATLRVHDADWNVVGELGPLDLPYRLAVTGDVAVAALYDGAFVVADLSEPAHPEARALWGQRRDESGAGALQLGEAVGGLVPLWGSDGVSLIDASDPRAPVEVACLGAGLLSRATDLFSGDGFLAIQGEGEVLVFDTDPLTVAPVVTLVSVDEGTMAGEGARVAVWEDVRTVALYEWRGDHMSLVVRRTAPDLQSLWAPAVAGGFALHGGGYATARYAFDLRADDLEVLEVDRFANGYACPTQVLRAGTPIAEVLPNWDRSARFAVGTAPCPEEVPRDPSVTVGAASPDGQSRLLHDGSAWFALDPASGVRTPLPLLGSDRVPVWWWPTVWVKSEGDGFDIGQWMSSWLTFVPQDGGASTRVDSPGPFVALASTPDTLWVLSEDGRRRVGAPAPPADERVLWRVGLSGAPVFVTLPAGAAPQTVIVAGSEVVIPDLGGFGRVLAGDVEVATLPMPGLTADGLASGSAAGVAWVDAAGALWWSPRDGSGAVSLTAACAGCVIDDVDGSIVTVLRPRDSDYTDWAGLVAWDAARPGAPVGELPMNGHYLHDAPAVFAGYGFVLPVMAP